MRKVKTPGGDGWLDGSPWQKLAQWWRCGLGPFHRDADVLSPYALALVLTKVYLTRSTFLSRSATAEVLIDWVKDHLSVVVSKFTGV